MCEQLQLGITCDRLLLRLPIAAKDIEFEASDRLMMTALAIAGAALYSGINSIQRVAPLRGRLASLTNVAVFGAWFTLCYFEMEIEGSSEDERYSFKSPELWNSHDRAAYVLRPLLSGIGLAATTIGVGRFVTLARTRGLAWSTVGVGIGALVGLGDIALWQILRG